jgi:hypothetical protein
MPALHKVIVVVAVAATAAAAAAVAAVSPDKAKIIAQLLELPTKREQPLSQ